MVSPHATLQKLALPCTCALTASQHGEEHCFCSPVTLSKPSLSAFLPQFPRRDQHCHLRELKVKCSSMVSRLLRQVKNMKRRVRMWNREGFGQRLCLRRLGCAEEGRHGGAGCLPCPSHRRAPAWVPALGEGGGQS